MPSTTQTLLGLIPAALSLVLFAFIYASAAKGAALLLYRAQFRWKQAIGFGLISTAIGFAPLLIGLFLGPFENGRWVLVLGHFVAVTLFGGWYLGSRGALRSGEAPGRARGMVMAFVSHVFLFGLSILAGFVLSQWAPNH